MICLHFSGLPVLRQSENTKTHTNRPPVRSVAVDKVMVTAYDENRQELLFNLELLLQTLPKVWVLSLDQK